MDLRQLRYFGAVVEAGSFTAAAAQLHISQPSLSVAIAKLESEVGVELLVRTPRGVEPTSAGLFLLDASARVLGEVDDIVEALARFGSGVAGSLTMAAVPLLMWHRVPELLRAHATEAPDLEIRLVDWGEVPLVAALPPDCQDAPDPLPLRAFDGEVVLLPRRTAAVPSLPEAVDATFRRHGIAPAVIRTVETIQAGLPLIEAGIARAILPDPDHASLRRFDVVVRPIEPAPRALRALVLVRHGAAASDAKISRLLDRIRGHAMQHPVRS